MIWEPDAFDRANEVAKHSNCSEFIFSGAEYLATIRGRKTVEMGDLQTVLDFIEGNRAPEVKP